MLLWSLHISKRHRHVHNNCNITYDLYAVKDTIKVDGGRCGAVVTNS